MVHRHVRHGSHTAAVREMVTECNTKLDTVDGSVYVQKVSLYKKSIEDTVSLLCHVGVLLGEPCLGRRMINTGHLLNFQFRTAP